VKCHVEPGWACSGGSKTTADTCHETCGDKYHYFQACDDGNTLSGDGCSSSCTIEDGFYVNCACAYDQESVMAEACDGFDYGYLPCDCGNYAYDSASAECKGCSYCAVV
jgi:cysteine-rich repeat protein